MDWLAAIAGFWMSWPEPVKAASITGAATLVAAVAGFAVIFFQLGRQAKNAIAQNRKNEALKLKVQIYEEAVQSASAAVQAGHELSNYLMQYQLQLSFASSQKELGAYSPTPPTQRYPEYSRLRSEGVSGYIAIMTMVERWAVVDRRLRVFGRVMAFGLDSHRQIAFAGPDPLIYSMPVDSFLSQWTPPTQAELSRVKQRIADEQYEIGRLSAWVHDFQIEMQMLLLSELFPGNVERRDPPDPEQFCVRLDKIDEIERRLDDSEWGRGNAEFEVEAWANFSGRKDRR